ncbi:cell adhesion molecule CEACAM7-like isoform X4 [Mixophyes fleayi]|uniref:cell adhesion molecule CEACAM7-like isoform X4 n=1 Tax=Mixophyes fleayi TaxID=3061075 RepID=UPI003F4E0542
MHNNRPALRCFRVPVMMNKGKFCGRPRVCVLAVLLTMWMNPAVGQIIDFRAKVDESVILSVTGYTGRIRFLDWYKGNDTNAGNQILRINSDGSQINGSKHFSEAKGFPNGSLLITNVQKELAGLYTVAIQADSLFQRTVNLIVEDDDGSQSGLGAGAIAGICIGVLAALGAVVAGVHFGMKSKQTTPSSNDAHYNAVNKKPEEE